MEFLDKLYKMTAISSFVDTPSALLMILVGMLLLYLGIKKEYEPLLLIPIGFGVLLANALGANLDVAGPDEVDHMTLLEIAKTHGIL
ncbi:MAG: sodium ion-translocating decarboxylase subunit beta, partial [Cyclobacteriaceae bacterium]|nr:sodium ion-translocating decarboxylase subunit beta [Cyclobacteriaceae bacterium]